MPRSSNKFPFAEPSLFKKIKSKDAYKQQIKVWKRASTIYPEFIGYTFLVHNGKSWIPISVTTNMVGYKFGEFVLTRKLPKHSIIKRGGKSN